MGFHKDEYEKPYQGMAPNELLKQLLKPSQALENTKKLDAASQSIDELIVTNTSESFDLSANVGLKMMYCGLILARAR